ncbi:MAG: glycine/sarcosine/betaine reductase selenoprotein B family protein, partial [Terriglobales bacterium]
MSRKCVPYTPVTAKVKEMAVALVSSTGVFLADQEPFGDDTDVSYRVIPGEADPAGLRFKHGHFDESHAQKDANTVFPLGLLQQLASDGFIRKVSNKHIGFKGFSTNLKAMYEEVAPAIAAELERSQTDAVVLTAGCPVCHRVAVAVQREIEGKGIPTVSITVVPDETKLMRPSRAIYPVGHIPGKVLG